MKIKFAIGIPTYNRADLLLPALMFYAHDYPNTKILVIDNGNQDTSQGDSFPAHAGCDACPGHVSPLSVI